jgi:hypothetical protein
MTSNWNKRAFAGLMVASAFLLAPGCATTSQGTWEVNAGCENLPRKPDCKVGGKVGGSWGGGGKQQMISLAAAVLAAADVADAALFEIDVSGSTIPYPASGTTTLTLKDTITGVVQAAAQFAWYRIGSIIRLSDPDAVNNWALANGGSANELSYQMTPFSAANIYGEHSISVASKYAGQTTAAATSTFYRCSTYPSPYQCMQ